MSLRILERKDLEFAVSLTFEEGWNYTSAEIGFMLDMDPEGSFIYEEAGEPLGIATTVTYSRTGVLGHLVVSKKGRGKRIGHSLLGAAIDYMHEKGASSMLVFATPEAVKMYQRHGFEMAIETACMHLRLDGGYRRLRSPECSPVVQSDLPEIINADRELFGDDRGRLIEKLFHEYPAGAFKIARNGRIEGFILARPDHIGNNLGPWACLTGDPQDAEALFRTTMTSITDGKLYVGPFADNPAALRIANELPTIRSWKIPLLIRGERRYTGDRSKVFGIAAYELG